MDLPDLQNSAMPPAQEADDASKPNRTLPSSRYGPELLSTALLLALPAFMLLAVLLRPFGFADLGWQLRLGEIIYRQGSPFVAEPFAATHLGEALTPNAWLGQLIFAQVREWSGLLGLRALDALLWIGGILAAALPARHRRERPLAILLALLVGFTVALPSASIRPQSFALLGFGLTLVLAQTVNSPRKALLIGGPMFVLWQNLHPSVPIAALAIAAVAALRWARHLARNEARPWALTALTVAAGISVFATPAGWHIVEFARYNEYASRLMEASEWFPLWAPVNREFMWLVIVGTILATGVAYRNRDRIKAEEVVPALVCLAATILAVRFIPFFGIALVPILARAKIGHHFAPRRRSALTGSALTGIVMIAELLIVPVRFEPQLPVAAVTKLKETNVSGTIFCDPAFGGLVADTGYPDWTVSFDGRFYRYTPDEWRLFQRTSAGPISLASLDDLYKPVAYVLAPTRSEALIRKLRGAPARWRQLHADAKSVVFVRSASTDRRR